MICNIYYVDWDKTNYDQRWYASEGRLLPRECFTCVCEMEIQEIFQDEIPDHLEYLFRQFNIGDHGGQRIRSMSVGDIVEYVSEHGWTLGTYLCNTTGWKEI